MLFFSNKVYSYNVWGGYRGNIYVPAAATRWHHRLDDALRNVCLYLHLFPWKILHVKINIPQCERYLNFCNEKHKSCKLTMNIY